MLFDELYKIIVENESIDEYEDWTDWLEYNDTDIELNDCVKLKEKFGLSALPIIKDKIIKISDDKNEVYLEFFPEHKSFDVWAKDTEDAEDNIMRMQEHEILDLLGIEEDSVWISGWDGSIKDAREHPGTVFHYTTAEKWEAIQEHGKLIPSYGTGLTNRSAHGIFTTLDAGELADGTYGDVCLSINLSEFQKDNNLPQLDLYPEPEVMEVELRHLLYSRFGLESREGASSDMSTFTVIVGHVIPLKYVTVYRN